MNDVLRDLLDSFDDSLWLRGRVRALAKTNNNAGRFVLYWMHNAVRAHENPALDVALHAAACLKLPLLVYHAISERYPFASDRLHTFMLEGAQDVQREFSEQGIPYAFHLERNAHRGSHLRTLANEAALVVTEDVPVRPLTDWLNRLTETTSTPIWAVDSSCVVPMQLIGRAYTRAFEFRRATQPLYDERLGLKPPSIPFSDTNQEHEDSEELNTAGNQYPTALPFEPIDLQNADFAELIGECQIDHAVAPVPHTRGGSKFGYERWERFKESGLQSYAKLRNNALVDGVSRMSAYLHFGMVSPFRIAREASQFGGKGGEKYLDELLIWRELAWAFCFYQPHHESLAAIPDWAVKTLQDHQLDQRPVLHDWETLARGKTGDDLWDAAQRSLLIQGELHNNVRMTWGKAILQWTSDAATALTRMIDLNHRYALDGRDPASYGGLLWCLGQFDRPFKPPHNVIGTVRPRPTNEHAKRLDPVKYLKKTTKRLLPSMPTVAVIGAGISGLAAARTLTDHGFDVTVFDKGRSVGGRMSTRRTNIGLTFDHGAQYFSAKDERFRRHVDSWMDSGVVDRWAGRIVQLADGKIRQHDSSDRFVGVPGMNAVCKHLACDVHVKSGTQIESIVHDDVWRLASGDGDEGTFDFLISAIPPAQAWNLLQGSTKLSDQIASIPFQSCWTVMLAFSAKHEFAADGAIVHDSPISWIARNSSKPLRDTGDDCWVIQASPEWTVEHLESSPDEIIDLLTREFFQATGTAHQQPLHANAHRWRYSIPAEPFPDGCLADFEKRLIICGDWCHGNRVESAFLSGMAAAGRLMRHVLTSSDP